MAWGFWNKVKKGFQKVGKVIEKGAKWVKDKVIKPTINVASKINNAVVKPLKPLLSTAAGAAATAIGGPAAGMAARAAVNIGSNLIDGAQNLLNR